jgi:hypothetical protein
VSNQTPWLRFHAYVVGLPKTGSTSLAGLMGEYRAGHETWLDFLASAGVARARGEIDDAAFWATVKRRFVPLRAEMDSVTCHHLYADILLEHYPKAKFIVTYRDVGSWANSMLSMCTYVRRMPTDYQERRRGWIDSYGDWAGEGTIPFRFGRDDIDTVALPALMRTWATYMHHMPTVLPAESTLWLKTSEITARAPELAEFLRIPVDSLAMDAVHSNRTVATFDRFVIADRDEVDRVYAEHCAELMAEHFPDEHARILNRTVNADPSGWDDYLRRVDAEFVTLDSRPVQRA